MTAYSHFPRATCDVCGDRADAVHFLPWVTRCERVEFSCPKHDLGGYWYSFDRFWDARPHTGIWHVSTKLGGWHAIALLFERLHALQEEETRRFDAAAVRTASAAGIDTSGPCFAMPLSLFLAVDADAP